jgi:hypothetical protein
VIGVVIGLGFVLLLIAPQAPLIAAVGVLTNLLAIRAAFGIPKLVFQDGALHSLLGFQPRGSSTRGGPCSSFAMILAISIDYPVFLLCHQGALGPHPQRQGRGAVSARGATWTGEISVRGNLLTLAATSRRWMAPLGWCASCPE